MKRRMSCTLEPQRAGVCQTLAGSKDENANRTVQLCDEAMEATSTLCQAAMGEESCAQLSSLGCSWKLGLGQVCDPELNQCAAGLYCKFKRDWRLGPQIAFQPWASGQYFCEHVEAPL